MLDVNGDPMPMFPMAIVIFVFYAISIVSSVFRLTYRSWRRQLYWDDFWAAMALAAALMVIIRLGITFAIPIHGFPLPLRSFVTWIAYIGCPVALWTTRLSISITILRFFPPGPMRNYTFVACCAMAAMGFTVVVQKFFMCGSHVPALPYSNRCVYTRVTPIFGLVTNFIANAWLILWPIYILNTMRLPQTYCRLLIACFCSSVLVCVVNALNDVYFLRAEYFSAAITGHIQVALSVFVGNILILVSFFYQYFRNPNGSTDQTTTTEGTVSKAAVRPRSRTGLASAFAHLSRHREDQTGDNAEIGMVDKLGRERGNAGRYKDDMSRGGRTRDRMQLNTKISSNQGPSTTSSTGPLTTLGSVDFEWDQRSYESEWDEEYKDDVMRSRAVQSRGGLSGAGDVGSEFDARHAHMYDARSSRARVGDIEERPRTSLDLERNPPPPR